MHALLTRTLAAAAVLAVVPPLAAAPASARPEPGPSPTVTSWERPDGYDPGWRASVDGRPASVLRANVAFRAVAVSAGRHVIEMVYRPPLPMAGLVLSGISLLLIVALLLWSLRMAA